MLEIIGKVYLEKAKQHQGKWLGIEGFVSNVAETTGRMGQYYDLLKYGQIVIIDNNFKQRGVLEIQMEVSRMQESGDVGAEEKLAQASLNIFWGFGKIEVSSRKTCLI